MGKLYKLFDQRTSTRRYETTDIPQESLDLIYSAITNIPTSYNGQQFCVIDVVDQNVKEKLYKVTNQKQIKTCKHFMVFCIDYHKIDLMADTLGVAEDYTKTLDSIIVGTIDASIAMSFSLLAAQSVELGTCCVGYVRTANPDEIAEILDLPPKVMVVCGLAIGVPREYPLHKPKQQPSLVIHKNKYSDKNAKEFLLSYNMEMSKYYENRGPGSEETDWLTNIFGYYKLAADEVNMLDYVRKQGFDIKK